MSDFDKLVEEINQKLKALETEENNNTEDIKKIISSSLNCCDYTKELASLIGLEDIKREIEKLKNYLLFYNKVRDKIYLDRINLNMVFYGNPGTGKTTIARIITKILYNLGYIDRDIFAETTPRDFIAGYVGQTALKTNNLLKKCEGGVIFIDEAYGFCKSKDENGVSFSDDAIVEIIKEMEKKKTIFIFSGYVNEMNEFIDMNPGIKSRVGYHFHFSDYTEEDLLTMFLKKIELSKLNISIDAICMIKEIIKNRKKEKNFGNGRMIDNLYDEVIREHAYLNVDEEDENKLLTITEASVKNIDFKKKEGGFFV